MDIIKNRRGQIFTVIAIALISLTFITISIYSHIREKEVVKDRVKSMDGFLHALEQNLNRQAYISGFRIIFLALSEKVAKGSYVTDLKAFSEEAFYHGIVDGIPNEIMDGATLQNITDAVNDKARKINVNITMVSTNISLTQEDPWNVKFVISSDFFMRDLQGLASWNKTQNITAYIPVSVFEDPLYLKNAEGTGRKIIPTPYDGHFNVSGDISNLSIHIQKGYFASNPDAPSFLGRLQGNLNADPNGIESFVDIENLTDRVVNYFDSGDESVIDYLFFDENDNTPGVTIPGINPRFKIDVGHKARYQLA